MATLTKEIITAAIAGFEAQKKHIEAQIAELRSQLAGSSAEPDWVKPAAAATKKTAAKKKRTFSAAQRKAQGEKMRAFWAAKKKAKK